MKEFFNDFADKYYSVPDFTNEEHVYALQNYLIEQGMLTEDIDFAIKTLLFEAPDKPDPKVAKQAKQMVGDTALLEFVTAEWAPLGIENLDTSKQKVLLGDKGKLSYIEEKDSKGKTINAKLIEDNLPVFFWKF